ncbi:bifunctional protein-serine/threonine kinase/phosphatase [Lichenicoccus sp.]|uniref:bifunctional protein-serine/threonine kinase/phosphatase n=1 Tax=Lichenicoccus sp. TaxID=2781899 RepID=UPI003D10130C
MMKLQAGFCSDIGKRTRNEDYVAVSPARLLQDPSHAAGSDAVPVAVAVVADGLGGHRGGRVAAELAVRLFLDGFGSQNPALGMRHALGRSIDPVNRWIHAIGRVDAELEGMACTFTALVLRGRQAFVVNVGDSRLYRRRAPSLQRLTSDDVLPGAGRSHILTRAIGLQPDLAVGCEAVPAQDGDRYLLCSDGVHGALRDRDIARLLASGTPAQAASLLVRAASAAGSTDNLTACVLDVLSLPPAGQDDLAAALVDLPCVPDLREGQSFDGFRLERALPSGRDTRVFVARDTRADAPVVLKLPRQADPMLLSALAREAWIGSAVRSPWLGEVIDLPAERRSALYLAMPFYAGETLERRLRRAPRVSAPQGIGIGVRLCKAVAGLHRAGVIHRDIKPENIVLTEGGGLRLIDFGVARLPQLEADAATPALAAAPGTASFRAPEMLAGEDAGSVATDIYALGVTLYRAFTGAYPYGEIEPFSHPHFGVPQPLLKLRPDLPPWLDRVLLQAVAVAPAQRYADAIELLFALEHGEAGMQVIPSGRVPVFARDPLRGWQIVSAVLALALLASLALR